MGNAPGHSSSIASTNIFKRYESKAIQYEQFLQEPCMRLRPAVGEEFISKT
jgi:hypothetical protein